jgi:hypothetical protein
LNKMEGFVTGVTICLENKDDYQQVRASMLNLPQK